MPEFIVPEWPAPRRVRCLQTTRQGGVSLPPYDSFNLGDHVGDAAEAVAANRALLAPHLPGTPVWLAQVHGTRVLELPADKGGPGEEGPREEGPWEADGVVSRSPGQVCAVMTADCLPVLFCDRAGTVVAAAHAGWRGLLAGILENTVTAMGIAGAEILAWLGPAIGAEAFEVGAEVRAAFLARDAASASCFWAGAAGRYWADLQGLARQRLAACGLQSVQGGSGCTYRDSEAFFSYRRDGHTGRMASLIWLEDV